MTYPCPRCMESELTAREGSHWLYCPSCGRDYDPGDMEEYYSPERQAKRDEARDARDTQELVKACWDSEVNRQREPGGGDDGLSMTWDIPPIDDSIVRVIGSGCGKGARGKKLEPANSWLSVRGLPKVASRDIVAAIEHELSAEG